MFWNMYGHTWSAFLDKCFHKWFPIVLLVHMLSNIHGMCTRAEHVSLVSSAYVVTTTCTLSDTLREQ